jgi:hypothetical protein
MAGNITAANANYTILVDTLFPQAQTLQGFATDDIFDTDPLEVKEVLMGVDGRLSAGKVFVPVRQGISLQADSDSNGLFDEWNAQEEIFQTVFFAQGNIFLPALGLKWALVNGVLATFPPIPNAGKTLKPRKFFVTWERVQPSLI